MKSSRALSLLSLIRRESPPSRHRECSARFVGCLPGPADQPYDAPARRGVRPCGLGRSRSSCSNSGETWALYGAGNLPAQTRCSANAPRCSAARTCVASVVGAPVALPRARAGRRVYWKRWKSLQIESLSLRVAASGVGIGRPGPVLSRSA